jgi:phosphoglycerate dehydrogenase-like enzyme
MKFTSLLMMGFSQESLGEKEWSRINSLAEKVILVAADSSDLKSQLALCDGLLVKLGATVDKAVIDSAPRLKYVGMFGTGYGRIDTVYAKEKGVTVCNISGYSREGVAELVFGMLLEHIRELSRAKIQATSGDYSEATFKGFEIRDKNFGVIGLGRNGSRVAEIAHDGFDANVTYWSRNRKEEMEKKGIKYQELSELLKTSDIVSINVAYIPETKGLLGIEEFKIIKPGSIVVSTVQNEVYDFQALVERLKKGDISFIFDHPDELSPEQAKELSQYENCIMYPPVGYITKEATVAKFGMFVDNLENFLAGKPSNKVN